MSLTKHGVRFVDSDGELIGRIFINDNGEISFEGKATDTAEIFFNELIRLFNEYEMIEYQQVEE